MNTKFISLIFFFFLAKFISGQSVNDSLVIIERITKKIIKEESLTKDDMLKIEQIPLKNYNQPIFFKISYTNKMKGITNGNRYCLMIRNKIYIQNEKNSRTNSREFIKIKKWLIYNLDDSDSKSVLKKFELKTIPGCF